MSHSDENFNEVLYSMMALPQGKRYTAVVDCGSLSDKDLALSFLKDPDFVLHSWMNLIQISCDDPDKIDSALDEIEMLGGSIYLDFDLVHRYKFFELFSEVIQYDYNIALDRENIDKYVKLTHAPVDAVHITGTKLYLIVNVFDIILLDISGCENLEFVPGMSKEPVYAVKIRDITSVELAEQHVINIVNIIKEYQSSKE